MREPIALLACWALLALTSVSCGTGEQSRRAIRGAGQMERDDRLSVAASVYPLSFLVREAVGDRATVHDLTKPGVEPHDAELSARQVRLVSRADLVVYLGGHFQPVVERSVIGRGDRALDVLEAAHREEPESPSLHEGGGHSGEGTPAGAELDSHSQAEDAPHLHSDPHVWLDPARMAAVNRQIAGRLADLDPAGASTILRRASTTERKLAELDAGFLQGLRDCQTREIVTGHGAFGYLAERYGIEQTEIGAGLAEAEPTPRRMARLAEYARAENIQVLFFNRYAPAATVRTLALEIGADTAMLDSIEAPPPSGDYFSAMRQNLSTLRKALKCK